MSSDNTDELVAQYRARITEAERHNQSAADALLRELAAILSGPCHCGGHTCSPCRAAP